MRQSSVDLNQLQAPSGAVLDRHLSFAQVELQDVFDAAQDARQFLDPGLYEQNKLALFHMSLTDFFSDAASSQEFFIDPIQAHGRVAEYYASRYTRR